MALREIILASDDIASESVHVPEWDVTIEVRSMSLAMRERIGDLAVSDKTARDEGKLVEGRFNAAVVVATCYDPETGGAIFTDADVPALNQKSGEVMGRLSEIGARLSGLTDQSQKDAGKDSASIPVEDSSSS